MTNDSSASRTVTPSDPASLIASGQATLLGRELFLRVSMTDNFAVIRRPRPFRVYDPFSSRNADDLLNDSGEIAALDVLCLEVKNATVLGERAVLLNDCHQLITDSHHPEHSVKILSHDDRRHFERVPLESSAGGYTFNSPRVETIEIGEPTILLSSMESNNYGAFLLRAISKLIQTNRIGLNKEKVLIASRSGWQRKILNIAGVDSDRIVEHDAGFAYNVSNLIIPSLRLPNFFLDDASVGFFQEMHEKIGRVEELPTGLTPRVYISRLGRTKANPDHRAMQNEEALISLLKEKGFTIFEPEAHTFEIQTLVFGQAQCIIGPGGAGMFNTIFCRPGTTVISIEPQKDWLVMHANIFASMGHRYGLVVGGSDIDDPSPQKRWRVDLSTISELVDNIC